MAATETTEDKKLSISVAQAYGFIFVLICAFFANYQGFSTELTRVRSEIEFVKADVTKQDRSVKEALQEQKRDIGEIKKAVQSIEISLARLSTSN